MSNTFLCPFFKLDALNSFVVLAMALFSVLTVIYSARFMKGRRHLIQYYIYIVLTGIASILAALSNDFLILLMLWGFLGFTLYMLISMGSAGSDAAAKKTFIIVGGTDALMLLGIGIIYYLTGTSQMDKVNLSLQGNFSSLPLIAYLCIAVACFAKAGAMPFHSWIPDCAEHAPLPVVAYLPASLDKLLGIYLLARLSLDLFVLTPAINIFLMFVGSFTIIAAVMMALVQSNIRKLLAYLIIASSGYMLLGLGAANPAGIAGGLFYMLNSAICNSCLFLCMGNTIFKTNTSELDQLGGLAKVMPLTYMSFLIASLSISGVPPFNGFVSKWMVYQGLIEGFAGADYGLRVTAVISLAAAMFGSALTLASFLKLLHATFLGQQREQGIDKKLSEVPSTMWIPCIILAALCVIFGVFANQVPLKYFILPAVGGVDFIGKWSAGLSTLLILIGLVLGVLIFSLKTLRPAFRRDIPFVGTDSLGLEENRVTGVEFYNTIKEFPLLGRIYDKAQAGAFDIYEQGKNFVFGIGKFLQYLHNGVLPTYLVWILLGMVGLFWVLLR